MTTTKEFIEYLKTLDPETRITIGKTDWHERGSEGLIIEDDCELYDMSNGKELKIGD